MNETQVIEQHRRAGRTFQAAGVGSFVREEGEGPAVVCMHGVPSSSFLYRKVLPELAARGLRGVAFDLPGLGLRIVPLISTIHGPGSELGQSLPSIRCSWNAFTSSSTTSAGRSASS